MGEALLIGGAIFFGGIITGLIKSHPFYKYETQKFKNSYQAKLWKILLTKYSEDEAYWISRALTDYIYDFSERLYEDVHIERYIRDALQERKDLYKYQIVAPQALCEQLVLRAVELKVHPKLFFKHMRELFGDHLVPMGKLTPKSIQSMPGAVTYYLELVKLPLSAKQMTNFIDMNNQ